MTRRIIGRYLLAEADDRVFLSPISRAGLTLLLISDTAYFVYLGYVVEPMTLSFVECHVTTAGAGAQTAEFGYFTTPNGPNKAGQTLTKVEATGTVDTMTGLGQTGVKRNTSVFSTSVENAHLWAGCRTALATTQPVMMALGADMAQGFVLKTAAAGALTASTTFTGAIIAAATGGVAPDLRGTLD